MQTVTGISPLFGLIQMFIKVQSYKRQCEWLVNKTQFIFLFFCFCSRAVIEQREANYRCEHPVSSLRWKEQKGEQLMCFKIHLNIENLCG